MSVVGAGRARSAEGEKTRTDVDVLFRTRLYVRRVELGGELLGLLRLHLSGRSVRKSRRVGNASSRE